jgi:hypothetical protein
MCKKSVRARNSSPFATEVMIIRRRRRRRKDPE